MGCFNVSCGISNLSINYKDKVKFIVLENTLRDDYENINKSFININEMLNPALLPITGYYDEYGKLIDIEMDENVAIIENHFNRDIYEFIEDIVGFSTLKYGYMFVLDGVYNELVNFSLKDNYVFNCRIKEKHLKLFGFKEVSYEETFFINNQYPQLFKNETLGYDLFFNNYSCQLVPTSLKAYLSISENELYKIKLFWANITDEKTDSYPTNFNENNEFEIVKKYLEDSYGYTIGNAPKSKVKNVYTLKNLYDFFKDKIDNPEIQELKNKYTTDDDLDDAIYNYISYKHTPIMNTVNLSDYLITRSYWNFLDGIYKKHVLKGKLKEQLREFYAFESSMYSCNKHYSPSLYGEQFGNTKASKMLLNVSNKILKSRK